MSQTNAWREVAIRKADKQAQMVDDFTEDAPFLAAMPVQESSAELSNVAERILNITGADTVDLDAALPTINAETELVQTDLQKVGGLIEVGKDKAKALGGPQAYFAGKMPWIMRETGMAIEKSFLYNSFRAYAFQEGKLVGSGDDTGVVGEGLYTILCITFVPGEMYGLVGKGAFNEGKAFFMDPLVNGGSYKLADGSIGYGMEVGTYMGANLNNPRYISGIVNAVADPTNGAFPTEDQLSSIRLDARATNTSSFYVMHPRMRQKLGTKYKLDHFNTVSADTGINTQIFSWDNVPIIETYNLEDGTEAEVAT